MEELPSMSELEHRIQEHLKTKTPEALALSFTSSYWIGNYHTYIKENNRMLADQCHDIVYGKVIAYENVHEGK